MRNKSIKTLKEEAWKEFSIYIRTRDGGKCFTCDTRNWDEELGEWTIKGMNAGHFIHNVLDFDEMNVNCQCVKCNKWNHGKGTEYSIRLIRKYGLPAVEKLHQRASMALKGQKYSEEEIIEIRDKYKRLNDQF